MTYYCELSTALQGVFGVCALALMAVAVFVLVSACSLRLNWKSLLAVSALTVAVFLLLQGILSLIHI